MYDGPTSELSTLPRDLTASGTSIPRKKPTVLYQLNHIIVEV